MMSNFYFVDWKEINKNSLDLAEKLNKKDQNWEAIIAIARGGLIPAAILAHKLNIHIIDTICIKSYSSTHQQQEKLEILKNLKKTTRSNLLVVDDLVDSGETFKLVRTMLPQSTFATVYAKPMGEPMVDHFSQQIPQDVWVVFPWEETDQISD